MRCVLTDFRIQIGNIEFKNPIFTASGTFGYGNDVPDFVDVSKLVVLLQNLSHYILGKEIHRLESWKHLPV